jgi:uncharacterized protein YbaR (Trm112 family)
MSVYHITHLPPAIDRQEGGYTLDKKLLEILACPLCKGPLIYRKEQQELVCKADRLAFPVRDDIPVMLEEEARKLPPDEEV